MFFDCHTHTYHSCDSQKKPEDAVISAINKGLSGISFTEHSDLRLLSQFDIPNEIPASCKDAEMLSEKYKGKIQVFKGIELSDAVTHRHLLKEAMSFYDYDIVLISVHNIDYDGKECMFSSSDFSKLPFFEIDKILTVYFEDMRASVYENSFDVLCHLTYPFRYINGIYKRGALIDKYISQIEDVFKIIIDKKMCLEINTAKCTPENPFEFCPEKELLSLYISLGGKMFTLGSDSHIAGSEGRCFQEASHFLKENGIEECYYFKSRTPVAYKI